MKTGEALAVGHLLDGRYRIHKLLGIGGMGRVYLANDTRLANRPVAVKEMLIGDGAQERKAIEDFHREASVLARLSHPSIPQIIDYFDEGQRHYLVMEYVAGGDLQHQLDAIGAGARMPEAAVLEMARQLLEVLQFLHNQKPPIIYRDLKPGNIMIDHHGRAMLVDFGIARFLPAGGRGTQIGSVGYAPPEQYLGKMEPRSDLYALAATMHHLLTGRDPQLQAPFSFPPVNELAPEVSAQTASVVMAALDKDVAHRPASALAMRDLLPKPLVNVRDAASGGVLGVGGSLRSTIPTATTVVLDQPVTQSRSPTPRLVQVDLVSKPRALSSQSISPSSAPIIGHAGKPASSDIAKPPPSPAARTATEPELRGPQSIKTSSNSKTADLGLRRPQNSVSDLTRGSSGKMLSRVAAAVASMRTAIGAGAGSNTDSPTGITVVKQQLSVGQSPVVAPKLSGLQNAVAASAIGAVQHTSATKGGNPRLVSISDGIQFEVIGNRLVLGRAATNGNIVDIDLSNLRRGRERISRRHAEIIKQGNDYFVRDLGSINGTYIAGRGRLGRDQLYKLKDHDELVLGSAKLEFRRS
ncbi:MAG: protein kinase [Deltaproteobacteria bacterium]|nr:protein kinase [Deltaproteobacteria bacterium]